MSAVSGRLSPRSDEAGDCIITKDYDYDKILQGILDIGEEMIVAGAEVSRVEDSISRMCRSYGGDRINVFIIYR